MRVPWIRGSKNKSVQTQKARGGGTSYCRVYGYVPSTRVDFSLPKIQTRPRFLKFYSRTGSFFDNLVSNVKNASCFPENDRSNSNFLLKKICLSLKTLSLCLSQSLSENCIATNLCCLEVLAFCSLMLTCPCKKKLTLIKEQRVFIIVLLYLSKEFQAFYYWDQFESGHMPFLSEFRELSFSSSRGV